MTKTYKLLIDSPEYPKGMEARWNDEDKNYSIYQPNRVVDHSDSSLEKWQIENRPEVWQLVKDKLDFCSPEAEKMSDKFIYDREQIQVDNKLISDLHNIFYFGRFKNIGHPITIGHVLSKIDKTVGGRNYYIGQTTYNDELIHLWSRCGELTQSLQEIVDASGWNEKVECNICGDPCSTICSNGTAFRYEALISPEANALFRFLLQIGL